MPSKSTRTAVFATLLFLGLALLPAPAQCFSIGGLFGSGVDPELVAQVPQDKRGEINKADFALACANQDIELAKLKEDLADKQDDLAALNTKLAKALGKAADISLDTVKQQAVIAAGLGKAEETQKVLESLRVDKTKNEADVIQIKAKIAQGELYVRDYTARVAAKEKSVAEFKARRGPDASPSPAKVDAAKPAAKADSAKPAPAEPVEIINKEPAAPPPPVPATPESDLKN